MAGQKSIGKLKFGYNYLDIYKSKKNYQVKIGNPMNVVKFSNLSKAQTSKITGKWVKQNIKLRKL